MQTSIYLATSLDGFIARADGAIDWLPSGDDPGEDYGYQAFFASVDVLVMGRATYDLVRGFATWPYDDKPVVVLTQRPLTIPAELAHSVTVMAGAPQELVERLAARGLRHAYIDGGQTIQRFLAAGLIQRMILTRVPVLLGHGLPLFGSLPAERWWQHVATRSYANGLVQSEYVATVASGNL
ncbi:dihydrofolate reductase family protein [Candidatus Viridilinea mediisalina]|uniref:Deaminase n=1 Tax=Candidatus Viridilinea mediisalina TaxID=2024553 RepID=A0A2A6RJL0_9CHLR|nr:dihydrofolate reductase family protein [Candidatus Viridilinea mediisalina]PDW03075.1 deaminase [Candidatus Viridilinea mediisalina]